METVSEEFIILVHFVSGDYSANMLERHSHTKKSVAELTLNKKIYSEGNDYTLHRIEKISSHIS